MNSSFEVKIITDLATEPVTVTEAKDYMRVIGDDEDTLIGELITSARQRLERFTGLSFGAKTIKCRWDYMDDWAELPYQPNAVVSSCVDDDNVALTYEIKGLEYKRVFTNGANGITFTYTTSFTLPKGLKEAILKEVSTSYENRENFFIDGTMTELSNSAKYLANPFSRNSILGIL